MIRNVYFTFPKSPGLEPHHQMQFNLKNQNMKFVHYFEIQTDQLISARQPDLVTVNKKKENLPNSELWHAGRQQSKTERK